MNTRENTRWRRDVNVYCVINVASLQLDCWTFIHKTTSAERCGQLLETIIMNNFPEDLSHTIVLLYINSGQMSLSAAHPLVSRWK
ncbi:hypothetical protein GDO81_026744 [Engystomops pustulosus]|uniref:Uncharacterized protein n=1 Tax=Engystomops pustulosus TaxID=76066 RepID=A0AAV6Z243_ENGPU|nr:hypothetical protein GDO81_026744 [Engystomops pustulosus]